MKRIISAHKYVSLKIKVVFALSVILSILAFFFSLKFAGDRKDEIPVLHLSSNLKIPHCSLEGGFYKESIVISLTNENINAVIYYTLDGSEPSLTSNKYDKPINIKDRTEERNYLSAIPTSPRWKPPIGNVFKGTILRAIAVDKENNKSEELIKSFFIDAKGKKRYSFPVVSLTVNEGDLFGYKRGIYVLGKRYSDKDNYIRKNIPLNLPWWDYPANYLLRGDDAERVANIEFYEPNGKLGFESKVGIRISGNATRGFAQKSLRIMFREKYGQAQLNYSLFPSSPINKFTAFILRNSGNDWDKTMFRDMFMQSLMQNTNIITQDYRPSIVFINGEYWGIHDICERLDENFISNKYNISTDSIIILEGSGEVFYGKQNEGNSFKELLSFIKTNDLSIPANYEKVEKQIDVSNFIDFLIANIYFCNGDWPNNNVRFWRYNKNQIEDSSYSFKDGRWRWMLYDTDWGFGYTSKNSYEMNLFEKAKTTGSVGILFSGLLKNKIFVRQFISIFEKYLNTIYNKDVVIKRINEFESIFAPEIFEHINRWRVIGSYNDWKKHVGDLRIFELKRVTIQVQQINDF